MGEFLRYVFSFPTIVFTILLGVTLLWWFIVSFGVIDDLDIDLDLDVDSAGPLSGFASLGFGAVPPALALTLVALSGWLISLILSVLLDRPGAGIGVVVLVVAFVVGGANFRRGSG